MDISQSYILLSVAALAVIVFLLLFLNKNRGKTRLTPLASLAFGFVLAGALFGKERLIGYGLMSVGVLLAVVDIFNKSKKA